MTAERRRRRTHSWQTAIALVTVWICVGGNFLAFRVALRRLSPEAVMSVRLLVAGCIMLVIALLLHGARDLSMTTVRSAIVAGVLLLVLGQGGVIWGAQYLQAGATAVFASSAPLFLALFSRIVLGRPLHKQELLGMALGCAGLAISATDWTREREGRLAGIAFITAGSVAWALGSLYEQRARLPANRLMSGALQMSSAAVFVIIVAWLRGNLSELFRQPLDRESVFALAYLALVGLVIGFAAFVWLVDEASPTVANTFHYVSPVIALIAGALMLDEALTWRSGIAALVALAGAGLVIGADRVRRDGVSATEPRRSTAHHDRE